MADFIDLRGAVAALTARMAALEMKVDALTADPIGEAKATARVVETQKPWEVAGIPKSTYYHRRRARQPRDKVDETP